MTDFVQTLKSQGGNYSLVSTWESGQQCDLTSATTKVFSHGGITAGPFTDGETINFTSGGSGLMIGVATTTQIMLETLTGTINSSDTATGATSGASVVISDAGNSASVVLECDAFTCSDSTVVIDGWTTGSSNYITIKAASGHEHGGVPSVGFIHTGGTGTTLAVNADYTVIQDIEIRQTYNRAAVKCRVTKGIVLERLIGYSHVSAGYYAFSVGGSTGSEGCVVRNCFIYGNGTSGIEANENSYISNCTVIGEARGVYWVAPGGTLKNTISIGSTAGFSSYLSRYPTTALTNATNDTTGYVTSGSPIDNVSSSDGVDFVEPSTDDYRIDDTSALYGAGTDLTGTFTDDIRFTATRISTSPDIGAYKFDVVTKTLKAADGDFASMVTWEATEQTNLVTDGDRHVLECDAFTNTATGATVLAGWTTDANHGITIKAAAGAEHLGVRGAGYVLNCTLAGSPFYAFYVNQDYVTMQDIEVVHAGLYFCMKADKAGQKYHRCIFESQDTVQYSAFQYASTSTDLEIINCLLINDTGDGPILTIDARATGVVLYNNHFINTTTNGQVFWFTTSGAYNMTHPMKNCVIFGDILINTTPNSYSNNDYNAFKSGIDATCGTNQITGVVITDATDFVAPSTGDYRIDDTSVLYGAGTDLTATFTDDIRSTATRISTSPDIGAYKFDVVTKTLKTGGDYVLISAWESTEQADLVATGNRHVLECDNETFAEATSTSVAITGWTTDATCFITIKPASGHEHLCVWGDGPRIQGSVGFAAVVAVNQLYTVFKGMEVENIRGDASAYGLSGVATDYMLDGCLVKSGTGSNSYGISCAGTGAPSVRNCIVLRSVGPCFSVNNFYDGALENNTAVGGGTYGFFKSGTNRTTEMTNCVAYGHSIADISMAGTTQVDSASGDTSASGTGAITGILTTDFVDFFDEDFTPTSSSALAGVGTDLSGIFTYDAKGGTRATPWDIGAIIAAAAAAYSVSPGSLQSPENQHSPIAAAGINGVLQ